MIKITIRKKKIQELYIHRFDRVEMVSVSSGELAEENPQWVIKHVKHLLCCRSGMMKRGCSSLHSVLQGKKSKDQAKYNSGLPHHITIQGRQSMLVLKHSHSLTTA